MLRGFAGRTTVSVINEAVAGHTVNQVTLGALDVSFVPQGPQPCAAPRHPGKRVSGRTAGSAVCGWLMSRYILCVNIGLGFIGFQQTLP